MLILKQTLPKDFLPVLEDFDQSSWTDENFKLHIYCHLWCVQTTAHTQKSMSIYITAIIAVQGAGVNNFTG